eukprot:765499-Hanusia_phi.AAC.3
MKAEGGEFFVRTCLSDPWCRSSIHSLSSSSSSSSSSSRRPRRQPDEYQGQCDHCEFYRIFFAFCLPTPASLEGSYFLEMGG